MLAAKKLFKYCRSGEAVQRAVVAEGGVHMLLIMLDSLDNTVRDLCTRTLTDLAADEAVRWVLGRALGRGQRGGPAARGQVGLAIRRAPRAGHRRPGASGSMAGARGGVGGVAPAAAPPSVRCRGPKWRETRLLPAAPRRLDIVSAPGGVAKVVQVRSLRDETGAGAPCLDCTAMAPVRGERVAQRCFASVENGRGR